MKFDNIMLGAHLVEDWGFQFNGGASLEITVDEEQGDKYEFSPEAKTAYFKLAQKPSPVDPEGTSPEEEIFIPMANVLCVRRSKRMQEPVPIEQKEAWQTLLREMVNSQDIGN